MEKTTTTHSSTYFDGSKKQQSYSSIYTQTHICLDIEIEVQKGAETPCNTDASKQHTDNKRKKTDTHVSSCSSKSCRCSGSPVSRTQQQRYTQTFRF